MDAPDPWLVAKFNHAFPFYLYAGFCVLMILLVWRLVPETKGRSLEEIEKFWSDSQTKEVTGEKITQGAT